MGYIVVSIMKYNHGRPRCGAKTRSGSPCQRFPVPTKTRCRLHGGLSTGPKTKDGKKRSLEALARGREQKRKN